MNDNEKDRRSFLVELSKLNDTNWITVPRIIIDNPFLRKYPASFKLMMALASNYDQQTYWRAYNRLPKGSPIDRTLRELAEDAGLAYCNMAKDRKRLREQQYIYETSPQGSSKPGIHVNWSKLTYDYITLVQLKDNNQPPTAEQIEAWEFAEQHSEAIPRAMRPALLEHNFAPRKSSNEDVLSSNEDVLSSNEDFLAPRKSSNEDVLSSNEDVLSSNEDVLSSNEDFSYIYNNINNIYKIKEERVSCETPSSNSFEIPKDDSSMLSKKEKELGSSNSSEIEIEIKSQIDYPAEFKLKEANEENPPKLFFEKLPADFPFLKTHRIKKDSAVHRKLIKHLKQIKNRTFFRDNPNLKIEYHGLKKHKQFLEGRPPLEWKEVYYLLKDSLDNFTSKANSPEKKIALADYILSEPYKQDADGLSSHFLGWLLYTAKEDRLYYWNQLDEKVQDYAMVVHRQLSGGEVWEKSAITNYQVAIGNIAVKWYRELKADPNLKEDHYVKLDGTYAELTPMRMVGAFEAYWKNKHPGEKLPYGVLHANSPTYHEYKQRLPFSLCISWDSVSYEQAERGAQNFYRRDEKLCTY